MVKGVEYHFKIVNLMKQNCLYSKGMKPLHYSDHLAESEGLGWHRVGDNITYSPTPSKPDEPRLKIPLYTLSFTFVPISNVY